MLIPSRQLKVAAASNWKPFKNDTCSVCRAMSNTTIHNRLGDFLISSHVYLRYWHVHVFSLSRLNQRKFNFFLELLTSRSNRLLPCCWRVKCFTFLSCWIRPFTDSRYFLKRKKKHRPQTSLFVVVLIVIFVVRSPLSSFCHLPPHCFIQNVNCCA